MPRGSNPNSRKNLVSNTERTPKQIRERNIKAGIRSGESRRSMKSFKELDAECTTNEERKDMLDMIKKRAIQGNLKAWELYADYMGMKPPKKICADVVSNDEYQESISLLKRVMEDDDPE